MRITHISFTATLNPVSLQQKVTANVQLEHNGVALTKHAIAEVSPQFPLHEEQVQELFQAALQEAISAQFLRLGGQEAALKELRVDLDRIHWDAAKWKARVVAELSEDLTRKTPALKAF